MGSCMYCEYYTEKAVPQKESFIGPVDCICTLLQRSICITDMFDLQHTPRPSWCPRDDLPEEPEEGIKIGAYRIVRIYEEKK